MASGRSRPRLNGRLEISPAAQAGLQSALQLKSEREQALGAKRSEYDDLTAKLRASDERRLQLERELDPLRQRITDLQLKEQAKSIEKGIPQTLALQYAPFGEVAELRAHLLSAAFERAFMAEPWPRTRAEFERRREEGRSRVTLISQELSRLAGKVSISVSRSRTITSRWCWRYAICQCL